MTLDNAFIFVTAVELFVSWLSVFALYRSKSCRQRLPALGLFLAMYAVTGSILVAVTDFHLGMVVATRYAIYKYTYWVTYVAMAILICLIIQQLFVEALSSLPGLRRVGLVLFRWITLVSSLMILAFSVFPSGFHAGAVAVATHQMMRGISVLELSLLAFLALSIHSLGFSFRSRIFGISLGFGMQAFTTLVQSVLPINRHTMATYSGVTGEMVQVAVLVVWSVYLFRPEPERVPVRLPAASPLLRWNEIAAAMSKPAGQVVIAQPSFFLQDVEKVVDKVLTKNPLKTPHAS